MPKLSTARSRALTLRSAAMFVLAGTVTSTVCAQTADDNASGFGLRWSGFATLGLTHHANDNAGVIASFSQKFPANKGLSGRLDTVGGLQADLRLSEGTSATVQAVMRAGDDFKPQLRMAYVRQNLGADMAVRVGRFRSPLFADSDVTEIGFAYLSMRPPLPIYGVAASLPHIDGADLQWRHSFGQAGVQVQAYAGSRKGKHIFPNTTPPDEADFAVSGIRGLAVSVGLPNVTLRSSYTSFAQTTMRSPLLTQLNSGLAQVSGGLGAIAANPFLPGVLSASLAAQAKEVQSYIDPYDSRPIYMSLGFDANVDRWRVIGELTTLDSRSQTVGRYAGSQFTLGYAWGTVTPYVTVSRNSRRSGSLDTRGLSPTGLNPVLDGSIAQLKGAFNQAAQFADLSSRANTVGLRWDVKENLAVKLQFDQIRTPSRNSPGVLAVRQLPFDNKVNLFGASLNYIY